MTEQELYERVLAVFAATVRWDHHGVAVLVEDLDENELARALHIAAQTGVYALRVWAPTVPDGKVLAIVQRELLAAADDRKER